MLKPNMIIHGSDCKNKSSSEEIAKKTLDCLKKMFLAMFLVLLSYLEDRLKLSLVRI